MRVNCTIGSFLVGTLCIVFLCVAHGLHAQESSSPADTTKTQVQREYQFLKSQIEGYRKFVQDERKEHREFIEGMYALTAGFIGLIVTIVAAILTFLGIKSRKDIKSNIEKLFNEHGLTLIDQRNEDIKISISELERLLGRETSYKRKSILFLTPPEDKEKFMQRELEVIESRGITSHQLFTEVSLAMPHVKNDTLDAIVYYYNPARENPENTGDENLRSLLEFLQKRRSKIPLIVYTYEKGVRNMLYPIDMQQVVSYPYAVFANFPITLVNLLHTVANYFPLAH